MAVERSAGHARPNFYHSDEPLYTLRPDATNAISHEDQVTHMDRLRIHSPRSFTSRKSSSVSEDSYSEDGPSHSSSSNTRPCNRYGWFVDSQEAQQEEEPISPERLRSREAKWLAMTSDGRTWSKYITKKFKVLRSRCRKGIPHAVRGRAWFYLCGGHRSLERKDCLFDQLIKSPGNEQVNEEITKDLHRQFPSHEIFANKDGTGQRDLYRVLKAYSIMRPKVGYCQGQAPLASVLLMLMPAEHAFWSLVNLCDFYIDGYFAPGLETLQLHGDMLFALLRKFSPSAYKVLKKQKIEPVLYMTEWFMCLFSRTLPWPSVLRVWDMFMCEGIIVIFKVAIVLLGTVLYHEKKNCSSMYETLQLLKNIPQKYMEEKSLIHKITKLELTESDLKREHAIQSNLRRIKKIQETKKKRFETLLEKKQQSHEEQQFEVEKSKSQRDVLATSGREHHQHQQQLHHQKNHSSSSMRSRSSYKQQPSSYSIEQPSPKQRFEHHPHPQQQQLQVHPSHPSSRQPGESQSLVNRSARYDINGHKKVSSPPLDARVRLVDHASNYYSRGPHNRHDSHMSNMRNKSTRSR